MDTFVQILCQEYNYQVVIPDIMQNTLYFGMQNDYGRIVNDEVDLRTHRLEHMIREFFANSYEGILENIQGLLQFYVTFTNIEPQEIKVYNWNNKDTMEELVVDYNQLFNSGGEYEVWDQKIPKQAIPAMLEDITERLQRQTPFASISGIKGSTGTPKLANQMLCKKKFGSNFYENLLLAIREVLQPGYFVLDKVVQDKIADYDRLYSNHRFHVNSLKLAEPNRAVMEKYDSKRFQRVKGYYQNIPSGDQRRTWVNTVLIFSGVAVHLFTKCLFNYNAEGYEPDEMTGRIFQRFRKRCETQDIFYEDITWSSLIIPKNINNWLEISLVAGTLEAALPQFKDQERKMVPIPPIARDAPPKPVTEKSTTISPFLIIVVIGIILLLFFV